MCIRRLAPPPPAQAFLCAPPPQALGASPLPCPPLAVPPWSRAKPTLVSSSPAARFELPGVARSDALCILPASTHADTCLRLGAGTEAMLIVKPKAFGFDCAISSGTSVSGAIVTGAIVSGAIVSGTVFTALSSLGPDFQTERPPPSTAGLTTAEHLVSGRLVYSNAVCLRGSLH